MNAPTDSRILIVDDTAENIRVIGAILQRAGCQIFIANDGLRGLEIARQVRPDLILLDVVMPEPDGFEVCRRLKADPELSEVPVVFLTSSSESDDVVRGFDLGAVDYVTKPFNAAELLSRVATHLQLRAARSRLSDLAIKLSRYLPPGVYDTIFSGERDARIETRRKPLTVFFSDIVGFTARAECLGDDALSRWLNGYLDEMAGLVHRFGGTLDKFIGDGVMVFFGDPRSDGPEADAARCVEMAAAMLKAAARRDIRIRIGMHSGECTVGNFGSERQMNYTIIGGVVNTAARLQSQSEPGRILVTEATRQLIQPHHVTEPRGAINLRGLPEAVMTHWVQS